MRKLEKISRILGYIEDLKKFNIKSVESLEDVEKFYATSQVIFNIVNEIIDLGEEICLKLGYYPTTYSEIIDILYQRKIIDEGLHKELKWLIRLRNIIAHRYHIIAKSDLFEAASKIEEIVRKFLDSLKEIL